MHTEQCHILQNSFPFYPTPLAVIGSTSHHTNLIPLMPLLDLSTTPSLPPFQHSKYQPEGESCRAAPPSPPKPLHLPSYFPSLLPPHYQPPQLSCDPPDNYPLPTQPSHLPSYFTSLPPPHYQPPQLPRDPPDNYPLVVRLTDIPRVSNYALSPRMRRAS